MIHVLNAWIKKYIEQKYHYCMTIVSVGTKIACILMNIVKKIISWEEALERLVTVIITMTDLAFIKDSDSYR